MILLAGEVGSYYQSRGVWLLRLLSKRFRRMMIRILLVDDHPIVRQGLRTLLESHPGWQVIAEASDGVEAVEMATALHPDITVLDLTMPRMNGLQACQQIRAQMPKVEVLFVTQHDSPQMMYQAMAAGARGYVVKSNAARDLLQAVEAVSQHRVFPATDNGSGKDPASTN